MKLRKVTPFRSLWVPKQGHGQRKRRGKNALRESFLKTLRLLPLALLVASLWVSPAVAEDADYPHNYVMNASCSTGACHFAPYDDNMCLECHDGSFATQEVSHSSATTSTKYGTWAMQCRTCHNPHLQAQYWTYGEASYVDTGLSDAGGITENTLTMSGAGWEENRLAGMVLFPNVDDQYADYNNYGIIGNTADTITVQGPMNLAEIGDGNKHFAVILGKLVRNLITTPNSGDREVRFFRRSGVNSFADGDATYDGVCEVCHTLTNHHRNDGTAPYQSHNDGSRCTTCHPHSSGFKAVAMDHTAAGVVLPVAACMECHQSTESDLVAGVHGSQCGLCHVDPGGAGPLIEPLESSLPHGGTCTDCHGPLIAYHGNVDHTATPGSGPVALFPDNGHDDAGWNGSKPYFAVTVDCVTCHNTNLPVIHGNICSTCHPTPYDTVGKAWGGGCQEGGCHTVFHEDSTTAHLPFSNPYDPANDCTRCHDATSWDVVQSNCLNCHADPTNDYANPPVTTSNAQATYDGPAHIAFSMTQDGKVGIGRTFYKLDGGAETSGTKVLVTASGSHELEFWSVNQAAITEASTNKVYFSINADTTPPTTTSDAKSTYTNGGLITLAATDDSTLGVKNTYYSLNGGPTQTGTSVVLPTTNGVFNYTLLFWSEDWAGNIETQNSVTFTLTNGGGTIRLVFGDHDVTGPPTSPDAWVQWTVYKGSNAYAPIVKSGTGSYPTWTGVDEISLPLSSTPYYVRVKYYAWWSGYYEIVNFPNNHITTPGQTIRLSY